MEIVVKVKCAECDHVGEISARGKALSEDTQAYMIAEIKRRLDRGHNLGHHEKVSNE